MAQTKRKGKPPNVSAGEVERLIRKAKEDATKEAVSLALVLMFTVLLDKYGLEEQIQNIFAKLLHSYIFFCGNSDYRCIRGLPCLRFGRL